MKMPSIASNSVRYVCALVVMFAGLVESTNGQVIFDGQTGSTLLSSLQATYTPSSVQSLASAKDLIYGTIYRDNDGTSDGVFGVYTGFFVPLDGSPNSDPSQDVFNIGNENTLGINLEHTWPQSKGAGSGNARSDMHHLFPTKVNVNSDRGSFPFSEINDASTTSWYRESQVVSTIPNLAIDEYSELKSGQSFEPREDHKGNVARAMFYFYTIYRTEADAADAGYFDLQKATLRSWHYADPPDSLETARNSAIATYQSGKINPFIQDQTLVDRLYFESELSVELADFTAYVDDQAVDVRWTSLSEKDNSFYTVSLVSGNGAVISKSVVDGAGLSSTRVNYAHTFTAVYPGAYSIKLHDTDYAGEVTEIGNLEVTVHSTRSSAFPNPAESFVTVTHSRGSAPSEIFVFDTNGRRVAAPFSAVDLGPVREYRIDVGSLARGVYFVRFGSRERAETSKFVVN